MPFEFEPDVSTSDLRNFSAPELKKELDHMGGTEIALFKALVIGMPKPELNALYNALGNLISVEKLDMEILRSRAQSKDVLGNKSPDRANPAASMPLPKWHSNMLILAEAVHEEFFTRRKRPDGIEPQNDRARRLTNSSYDGLIIELIDLDDETLHVLARELVNLGSDVVKTFQEQLRHAYVSEKISAESAAYRQNHVHALQGDIPKSIQYAPVYPPIMEQFSILSTEIDRVLSGHCA